MAVISDRNGSFTFIYFYVTFWYSRESVSHMWTQFLKCVAAQKAFKTADMLYIPPREAADSDLIKPIK